MFAQSIAVKLTKEGVEKMKIISFVMGVLLFLQGSVCPILAAKKKQTQFGIKNKVQWFYEF